MNLSKFQDFFSDYYSKLEIALNEIDSSKVYEAVELIRNCKGTVWLIGNGGSAALASHMATDLQLAGVRAIALTDVAAITTWANDKDYTESFNAQIERLIQNGDVVIAISGSGGSMNVVKPCFHLMERNRRGWLNNPIIGITGFDGGSLKLNCDVHINIPSNYMGVSQDGHQIVLHMICYYLMENKCAQ